MTEESERIENNIKKIERWLGEPDISTKRRDSLNDLLTRFYNMRDMNGSC